MSNLYFYNISNIYYSGPFESHQRLKYNSLEWHADYNNPWSWHFVGMLCVMDRAKVVIFESFIEYGS